MKLSKPGANKKTGEPLSAETILYHHRVIHTILKQAVKEGLIRINPSDNASPPKASRKEAKFLELEELIAIGNALKEQPLKWQSIIGLLIDSGGRRGEILALKWDDIDYKNKKINIHADLLYTPEKGIYLEETTKNGSSRMITISPEVIDILQKYRKEQLEYKIKVGSYWNETGFCFTQEDGSAIHPDSVNTWLTRFSKQYGFPHINPHAFRHS